MSNPFICGTFHHELEEDEEPRSRNSSPGSTPRKSSRRTGFCRRHNSKDDKNPYSTRGLDKFSALLADLEQKRQKIYSQKGSENISLVRFVYSSSNDCVPIVVKIKHDKDKIEEIKDREVIHHNSEAADKNKRQTESSASEEGKKRSNLQTHNKTRNFSWNNIRLDNLRRPSFYFPVVIILILLFLALFGRSIAILCTCIGWYIVPSFKESSKPSATRMSLKKKKKREYVRGMSEKKIIGRVGLVSSCPESEDWVAFKDKPPTKHGHQRSW